jgi:radical SAM protein with 4Fe4S-binding SPASM domain
MIKHRFDFINRYLTTFDDMTGEYTRSNVYDFKGKETQEEPFMGDFPHLLDIGIKGFCEHGLSGNCLDAGIYCYQRGADTKKTDMDIKDYQKLMRQCEGLTYQVALGGRGDADCHKDYEAILYSSRESGIVPNITTSGFLFDEKKANITEQYCGAAAVSWYKRSYTYRSIDLLLSRQVICNLHFILSSESIYEAVRLFETDGFPKGIQTVVFLLYKPIGYEMEKLVLKPDHPLLKTFFSYINENKQPFRIGFDSCLSPGVLLHCKDAAPECIEPCESGRFSAYIDSNMQMYPCSFVQKKELQGDLNTHSISEIWNSKAFDSFRSYQRASCPDCKKRDFCMGCCPQIPAIHLCNLSERKPAL